MISHVSVIGQRKFVTNASVGRFQASSSAPGNYTQTCCEGIRQVYLPFPVSSIPCSTILLFELCLLVGLQYDPYYCYFREI